MAISVPKTLVLIICITYAPFTDSYVAIKDKNVTAEDDDSPFTVHHVDELDEYAKYLSRMETCAHMSAFSALIGNFHHFVEGGPGGQNTALCNIMSGALECFNKTVATGFPRELLGEPEVMYEALKLNTKETFKEELSNAKLNYLLQFGDEASYPLSIDVDQCETLMPSMDPDAVPAKEICTIRALAESLESEFICYEEHMATAKLEFNMRGGKNGNRTFQEQFACEQVEDYMNNCLAGHLALCHEEGSARYLRQLLFDGHYFKDQLSKTVTHVEYYKDFWCNCRRKGYFGSDEIHSLSYFVKHEGACGKRNSTGSAVRQLDGIDKLFDMLSQAMSNIEIQKPFKTGEKVTLADNSYPSINALEGLGIGFLVLMVIICFLICLLALRERKTGRQLCSWCPAIRIPGCGWFNSGDVPYKETTDDNLSMN